MILELDISYDSKHIVTTHLVGEAVTFGDDKARWWVTDLAATQRSKDSKPDDVLYLAFVSRSRKPKTECETRVLPFSSQELEAHIDSDAVAIHLDKAKNVIVWLNIPAKPVDSDIAIIE